MAVTTDPLRMEVIKNSLIAITEEMSATLYRSAYSTNIKTRKDFSTALFDSRLRIIAQAFAQPAHLGALPRFVPTAITSYGSERINEGDVLIQNDPYFGATHLNDVCLIAPIIYGGEKVGYVANIAHHVDVGGQAPASIGLSKELVQEGIIIPPVKIVENGKLDEDLFKFLVRNVRARREVPGDIKAQIAANRTGIIRATELLERYNVNTINSYVEELLNYTERRTRQEFAKLPHGEYTGEDFMDDDGFTDQPIRIAVKVTINEDGLLIDFEGTEKQRRSPMNGTPVFAYTGTSCVLRHLMSDDIPVNDGFYRCINIKTPKGTVVNCDEPSGVVGGYETAMRVISTLTMALSKAIPERIAAANKGNICNIGFGGYDPIRKEQYAYLETIGGGYGGRMNKDGMDGVQCDLSNTENAPVEEVEINYPVRILRYELIPDSGGPGKFRGGLGIRRDYQFPYEGTTFTILADRAKFPPWGILGGKHAKPAKFIKNPDGENARLRSKYTFDVNAGDIVSIQEPGGGGYGDPFERDPEAVNADVINEKISRESARHDYGVVIEVGNTVNLAETKELRRTR